MRIAGTGHRPTKLGGYSRLAFDKLVRVAQTYLSLVRLQLPESETITVISGMALGWDQALAQAAVNLQIPFIAAIPCLGQERTWPAESQRLYSELLSMAASSHLVTNAPYQAWMMQRRNEWMVNEADRVVALWNGEAVGGTYNCISYCIQKKVQVDNLWDLYTGKLAAGQFGSEFTL
jgi:uncharacterized phage-like protein YoqJ